MMSVDSAAAAEAMTAPSYEVILSYLIALAQWLKDARDRLTCRAEVGPHASAVDALCRHHERAYGPWLQALRRRTDDASAALLPTAAAELAVVVVCQFLVLVLLWWALLRIVRAATVPRLRARQIAVQLRQHLSMSATNVAAVEAFIRPDAAQRGINASLLWTVGVCGTLALVLVLCLLMMHTLVDVMTWRALQRWTRSLRPVAAWVSSRAPWRFGVDGIDSAAPTPTTPLQQYAAVLVNSASGWMDGLFDSLMWLRGALQQAKMLYLWGAIGGAVLSVALWLLRYSAALLRSYDASLPYFDERDSLARWLAQQATAATQQRTDAALAALLKNQQRHARAVEALTSSLSPTAPLDSSCYARLESGAASHEAEECRAEAADAVMAEPRTATTDRVDGNPHATDMAGGEGGVHTPVASASAAMFEDSGTRCPASGLTAGGVT
ncbi:hypothetical protein NESM_000043000 [Novymonas esmeraldas]|uniref:Uncharacterized protein n=1 Tax=Novymonas esmeraldas TaxID=1808958 RepID=A0AAW0EZX3_9TRYP